MNCPVCGNVVGRNRRYCEQCGTDVEITARLFRLSNHYYNEGLKKAQIRDLSGAVLTLKKSLEFNKANIEARNLLGLVYFELGETVLGLSEWIISRHFCNVKNPAIDYIDQVQADPAKLDEMSATIRKFNLALSYAQRGSEDLAKLQLRKVLGASPNFVKALQLMALLYLKEGDKEKARRCLLRAKKCDIANTTTMLYLAETESKANSSAKNKEDDFLAEETNYNIAPPTVKLQDDKPNFVAWVTFFAGMLIGVAVLYFLVVPTVRSNVKEEFTAKERDYSAEIGTYTASISVLNSEKAALQEKNEKLKEELQKAKQENSEKQVVDTETYEKLMEVIGEYPRFLARNAESAEAGDSELILNEKIAYMDKLKSYRELAETKESTAIIYNDILMPLFEQVRKDCFARGKELYDGKKYEEAIPFFEAVLRTDQTDDDTLYLLGRSFQKLKRNTEAVQYYQMLLDQYPESDRYAAVKKTVDSLTSETE